MHQSGDQEYRRVREVGHQVPCPQICERAADCSSPADMLSTVLPLRPTDPVVSLSRAHPLMLAATSSAIEIVRRGLRRTLATGIGNGDSNLRGRRRPSSHLQKYSVNPNGWLRTASAGSCAADKEASPICPSNSRRSRLAARFRSTSC